MTRRPLAFGLAALSLGVAAAGALVGCTNDRPTNQPATLTRTPATPGEATLPPRPAGTLSTSSTVTTRLPNVCIDGSQRVVEDGNERPAKGLIEGQFTGVAQYGGDLVAVGTSTSDGPAVWRSADGVEWQPAADLTPSGLDEARDVSATDSSLHVLGMVDGRPAVLRSNGSRWDRLDTTGLPDDLEPSGIGSRDGEVIVVGFIDTTSGAGPVVAGFYRGDMWDVVTGDENLGHLGSVEDVGIIDGHVVVVGFRGESGRAWAVDTALHELPVPFAKGATLRVVARYGDGGLILGDNHVTYAAQLWTFTDLESFVRVPIPSSVWVAAGATDWEGGLLLVGADQRGIASAWWSADLRTWCRVGAVTP